MSLNGLTVNPDCFSFAMYTHIDMKNKKIILILCACFFVGEGYSQFRVNKEDVLQKYNPIAESAKAPQGALYADPSQSPEARAKDLLSRLTFDEKVSLTGGWNGFRIQGNFNMPGVDRLGIRAVTMMDASQGIRKSALPVVDFKSTSFPSLLALTSTWNPGMAYEYGKAMGRECRATGTDILLGPGMNFIRISAGGRHFEYLGEDPYLATPIATEYILGLQSEKVLATPKVVLANEQEFVRHIANCIVSNRAMHEIYLRPWKSVIEKADAKAIMTGNNLVNGIQCSVNKPLIADILRQEYGFKGIAMTDWQNTNYFPSMNNLILESGISLLMPGNGNFVNYIKELKQKGEFDQADFEAGLDKMVYYNLLPLFEFGVYDRFPIDSAYLNTYAESQKIALACAEESIVLLKNEGNILPIQQGSKNILVIGVNESHCGRGSGSVPGYDHTSFVDGFGAGAIYREKPSEQEVKQAGTVVFILDKPTGEGGDTPYEEPKAQLNHLRKVLSWNSNTVVIINATNTMPMDWAGQAKAILWSTFLGQERGNAMANVISGKVNPSGKMVFSVERDFKETVDPEFNYLCGKPYWAGNNTYKDYWLNGKDVKVPGFSDCVKPGEVVDIRYDEDIFIGYRWFDKKNIPVVYPFGHGLSYTTFKYSGMKVENKLAHSGELKVTVRIKNTGKVAGKEVAQLYISDLDGAADDRPVKELKGFSKIELQPGETREATFTLTRDDFAIWDVAADNWKIKTGKFEIKVGPSSQALDLKKVISL